MSDDQNDLTWPFPWNQFQQAGEQAATHQAEMLRRFLPGGDQMPGGLFQLDAMSRSMATFKTRVQSGGRVSIPDAEREALDISEGDIVQTIIIPIKRNQPNNNE